MATQTLAIPETGTKKVRTKKIPGTPKLQSKKKEAAKDLSKTYNEFKQFEGRQYTGMKVGKKS